MRTGLKDKANIYTTPGRAAGGRRVNILFDALNDEGTRRLELVSSWKFSNTKQHYMSMIDMRHTSLDSLCPVVTSLPTPVAYLEQRCLPVKTQAVQIPSVMTAAAAGKVTEQRPGKQHPSGPASILWSTLSVKAVLCSFDAPRFHHSNTLSW
ncbi:hypothetical protein ElyMa_002296200 [Elysia marginata]|uniref:Uncharacterized protein n=1 Tax=Elysia marginata TaxID=1093978 RepID=A0AAV4G3F6_9GAST|nr:hypothetical protein ElyMa_002296200 [Elysia marginata]